MLAHLKNLRRQRWRTCLRVMTFLSALVTSGCAPGRLSGTTEVVGVPCFDGVFDGVFSDIFGQRGENGPTFPIVVQLHSNRSLISGVGWTPTGSPFESFTFDGRFASPFFAQGRAIFVFSSRDGPLEIEAPNANISFLEPALAFPRPCLAGDHLLLRLPPIMMLRHSRRIFEGGLWDLWRQ